MEHHERQCLWGLLEEAAQRLSIKDDIRWNYDKTTNNNNIQYFHLLLLRVELWNLEVSRLKRLERNGFVRILCGKE